LNERERACAGEWRRLVEAGEAKLIGIIRQEILSGIRKASDYEALRERLRAFPDITLTEADYEEAARLFNSCRARGHSFSAIDLLICVAAMRRGMPVYSIDADFRRLAEHIPVKLHK
jgi:hypothetical protein